MIPRTIYSSEHEQFRDAVRRFLDREVAPYHDQWELDGKVSREIWLKAGEAGLLCTSIPAEYGGSGADFRYSAIITEEMSRRVFSGPGFRLHSDIVAPYILHYGSEEQKRRWLPPMARGEVIGALGMTEPGAGSDLQGIRTIALRDGNEMVLNGSKTFITNGQLADLVVVACKTDAKAGAKGISLVLLEGNRAGFKRGRNLNKIGLKAQDTSELFFDNVRLPMTNLLGEEGKGFKYLMEQLPQERLLIAITAVSAAEAALEWTLDYTKSRQAFGQPLADFQHNRFKLAEMKTEIQIGRVFLDRCLELHVEGKLDVEAAAMSKYWLTELEGRVVDQCLQMHGGYGYMLEYPIARAFADARVHRIYGGSNEIMRELVARYL
jgi:alkylation response protein AidB-like acyl-CoA dehydrogenase